MTAKKTHTTICAVAGCGIKTATDFVFCVDHMHRAYPCGFEGCPNTIAAYNKSGYCYTHRWIPQKLKRIALTEERAVLKEKVKDTVADASKPIVKKPKKVQS